MHKRANVKSLLSPSAEGKKRGKGDVCCISPKLKHRTTTQIGQINLINHKTYNKMNDREQIYKI